MDLSIKKKSFKIPSVFTIILFLMLLIVVITWIPGTVQQSIDKNGDPTNAHILGIMDIFEATIQGIMARADVIAFVLAIGAYIYLILKSQSLEAAMGLMIKKLKGKEIWLIPICIMFFGLSGTIYNMCEETIAYYPILIPVMMFAGFDAMTTIMVVTFGAGMGVLGSTIAPFSVIIASGVMDISPMDGIVWRILIFLLCMAATIFFTMQYAIKIKKDPTKSIVYKDREIHKSTFGHLEELPEFTKKRKAICGVFVANFVIMVLLELPWYTFFGMDPDTWSGNGSQGYIASLLIEWFPFLTTTAFSDIDGGLFIDLATLFFISSFVVGVLMWKSEEDHINSVIGGASDLLGVALIISTAGGVGILLDGNHSNFGATVAGGIASGIGSMPAWAFVLFCYIVFIPIAFLIPSTSGFALAILPLFLNSAQQIGCESGVVTAFVCAEGFVNLITPAGLPMACLGLAKVNYADFWRGCWKLILSAFLIPLVMLPLGALINSAAFDGSSILF
ncbi:hypothetical protein [Spiroplasma endosymbiont of Amphibalanus improvisus]|uniref:hypothetical protein n=1 Tax=Spiroplasma endosymbiont of Amphibalanus improvisus TaxID=3066327 RepID=UPI00313D9610